MIGLTAPCRWTWHRGGVTVNAICPAALDTSRAFLSLAGDGAEFVTGQMLVLDGGGPAPFPLPRPDEEAS